jgi:hypothetical protein
MSEIRATTISDTAGTGPITLTKQHAAKVFERHNSSHTINNSFGVSSIIDNGAGDTTVTYSNAFSAATQCLTASAGDEDTSYRLMSTVQKEASAATKHRYLITNSSFTASDCPVVCSQALGDLA